MRCHSDDQMGTHSDDQMGTNTVTLSLWGEAQEVKFIPSLTTQRVENSKDLGKTGGDG